MIDSTSSVAAAGSSGISSMTSRASFFRLMASASISTSSTSVLSSTGSMRALRYGALLDQLDHLEAGQPLDHQRVVVLPHLEELDHPGHGADRVEVGRAGVLLLGLALGHHADDLLVADGVLDEGDGLGAAHRERQDAAREEDRVAQGEDGEDGRDVLLVDQGRRAHGRGHLGAYRPLLLLVRHRGLLRLLIGSDFAPLGYPAERGVGNLDAPDGVTFAPDGRRESTGRRAEGLTGSSLSQ